MYNMCLMGVFFPLYQNLILMRLLMVVLGYLSLIMFLCLFVGGWQCIFVGFGNNGTIQYPKSLPKEPDLESDLMGEPDLERGRGLPVENGVI